MKWISRTPIMGSIYASENDIESVQKYVNSHLAAHKSMGESAAERMSGYGVSDIEKAKARFNSAHESAISFLMPEGELSRARASLLFIESYRELPLLAWPRKLIDAVAELEESMVKWRHSHARMVERIMGRRIGTGGTSGVDYLDKTSQYRVFKDLWAVRTILVKSDSRPDLINPSFYGFNSDNVS
jgi:tryptophan 2,3-dioxygenase